jgi:FkbM family methyltransferase
MAEMYKALGRNLARQLTVQHLANRILRTLGHARLLPAAVWKRLPVDATFVVKLPEDAAFKYRSLPPDSIGRALYWRGIDGWETETIKLYFRLAAQSRVILDIGANTGVYTLIACAASSTSTVYAFEPVRHIYQLLAANLMINEWQGRCTIQNAAIADRVGKAQFHIPYGEIPTSASLQIGGFRGLKGNLVEVDVYRLDEMCSNNDIDLVKIDVEGFEDKVLVGMENILRESAPAILVECNPDGPYCQVDHLLSKFGYTFYHILAQGPVKMASIQPDVSQRYRNYLCLPEERLHFLQASK